MGVTGSALEWLKSYFSNRNQFVHVAGASSRSHPLITGMPQGSVLGPFGFPTYTNPLGRIISRHGVSYHLYADDTQLYISFDPPKCAEAVVILEQCIEDVREWMQNNFLKLNNSKTEYLIVGTQSNVNKLRDASCIHVGDISVSSSSSVRNIGAIFDSSLSMADHVGAISRSCYTHIRNIGKIRPFLTRVSTETLVHVLSAQGTGPTYLT